MVLREKTGIENYKNSVLITQIFLYAWFRLHFVVEHPGLFHYCQKIAVIVCVCFGEAELEMRKESIFQAAEPVIWYSNLLFVTRKLKISIKSCVVYAFGVSELS